MQQRTGHEAAPGRKSLTLSEHPITYNVQFFLTNPHRFYKELNHAHSHTPTRRVAAYRN